MDSEMHRRGTRMAYKSAEIRTNLTERALRWQLQWRRMASPKKESGASLAEYEITAEILDPTHNATSSSAFVIGGEVTQTICSTLEKMASSPPKKHTFYPSVWILTLHLVPAPPNHISCQKFSLFCISQPPSSQPWRAHSNGQIGFHKSQGVNGSRRRTYRFSLSPFNFHSYPLAPRKPSRQRPLF